MYFKKSFFVRLAVFLGCLCTALALHHDAHSQDSLETKLRTARDAEKLALLEQLYRNYQASDFNKAIQFADAGISVANKLDDIRYIVVFNKYKAISLMDLGRNEEAVDILLPTLKLARDNSISDQEMFILNNIGLAYTYRGIYDSALSFHFKSLELREKSGRKASMFNSLNNIGLVYYKLKNPKLALNFYQRALDIKTELNDNTGVYALQVNIGLCYVSLNEYDNAISIINRALQSCGPSSSCDGKVLVDAYHAIGVAYLGINDLAKSETFLLKSYTLSQERNDTRYMIENLEALASVDFGNKQFEAAIKKLQQAEVLATNTDFVENRITIYEKLAEEYKRIPDYQKATIYQD
ncbi:MAG: tetratricopeptide repeat protein, partial [Bacteroidota bacterium]